MPWLSLQRGDRGSSIDLTSYESCALPLPVCLSCHIHLCLLVPALCLAPSLPLLCLSVSACLLPSSAACTLSISLS